MPECVRLFERHLGPDHPNTISSKRTLSHWCREGGSSVEARGTFRASNILAPLWQKVGTRLNSISPEERKKKLAVAVNEQ